MNLKNIEFEKYCGNCKWNSIYGLVCYRPNGVCTDKIYPNFWEDKEEKNMQIKVNYKKISELDQRDKLVSIVLKAGIRDKDGVLKMKISEIAEEMLVICKNELKKVESVVLEISFKQVHSDSLPGLHWVTLTPDQIREIQKIQL